MDDSHATGVLGKTGRGTAEHFGVLGEVDIITSTLGKALGGAAGGFVAGPAALCDMLTQRSRPQLFSNALPPTVAASALAAVQFIEQHPERVETLRENTKYFREQIIEAGFKPLAGETPIVPIIVGETAAAIQMSDMLLDEGVFVTGFGFPVVPQGQARVRCQLSAAHSRDDLDKAIAGVQERGAEAGNHLKDASGSTTNRGFGHGQGSRTRPKRGVGYLLGCPWFGAWRQCLRPQRPRYLGCSAARGCGEWGGSFPLTPPVGNETAAI